MIDGKENEKEGEENMEGKTNVGKSYREIKCICTKNIEKKRGVTNREKNPSVRNRRGDSEETRRSG